MKRNILIAALLFAIILPVINAQAKCQEYCYYTCLQSGVNGSISGNSSSPTVITINQGDVVRVRWGLVDAPPCIFFYADSMFVSTAGSYSVHLDHDYYFNVVVMPVAGINENEGNIPLNIFPNPASEEVTVRFSNEVHYSITMHNAIGELLFQTRNNSPELKLDIAALRKGIYFITLTDNEGNKVTRKIVKI